MLAKCMFAVSMQILQDDGYKSPSLDALGEELYIKRKSHSALEDVCNKKLELFSHIYGFTFGDILYHLDQKLPLPIQKVYNFAPGCPSLQELTLLLYEFVKPKTALNLHQVYKVGTWYFKGRLYI